MATDPAPHSSNRPRGVVLIAAVLVLEAVALVVLAVGSLGTVFAADPVSVGGSVFLAVLLLLVAAALAVMARKLVAGFRWPRSPSLVVQLFLVILAFPFFSSGNPVIGLALMVPAAAVIVTLFSKPVVGFTARPTGDGRTL
ncbi:hypothetical protein CVO76_07725 [Arthrobacter agilis]|uniref:Uncharacterized protein n=1 Tax=Arthrobacter agilis TaxID=37921 RepID=A0A2L0UE59_9MICC|nr:hypothetical protein [Arthrobacter agilis]AUZ87531.1 hypothetical protein CVO76_07725 [Arthrobacter agilis]